MACTRRACALAFGPGMTLVDLREAKILMVSGWPKASRPPGGKYLLEFKFLEEGPAAVEVIHARNRKMAFRFAPEFLSLTVRNTTIRSGGGFMGGGFGVEGAALGMLEGAVLNALTTRNKNYGMLTMSSNAGPTVRTVVLGWENTADTDIVAAVNRARVPLMDAWVTRTLERIASGGASPWRAGDVEGIKTMVQRGWLTGEQLERITPAIESGEKSQNTASELPGGPSPDNTVERLKELAALHASGALSDDEFAAAKARVLQ
jgi:hypothetical protein